MYDPIPSNPFPTNTEAIPIPLKLFHVSLLQKSQPKSISCRTKSLWSSVISYLSGKKNFLTIQCENIVNGFCCTYDVLFLKKKKLAFLLRLTAGKKEARGRGPEAIMLLKIRLVVEELVTIPVDRQMHTSEEGGGKAYTHPETRSSTMQVNSAITS